MFLLFITPVLLFVLLRCFGLLQNYKIAKRIGVPTIIIPFSLDEPLWVLLRPLFAWVQYLPFNLGSWYLYTELGFPTLDKTDTHSRLGDTFVLVSPKVNHIVTAYPSAVQQIYRKYKTWIKPPVMTEFFNVYGHSLSGVNGEDWQRHSKITAPAFSEPNFRNVWTESLRQSDEWLATNQTKRSDAPDLAELREDISVLAMRVLASVEFGSEAVSDLQERPPGHQMSLLESLNHLIQNVLWTVLLASLRPPAVVLPQKLKQIKTAISEFKLHMEEAVLKQMKLAHSDNTSSATTLVAAMVKANEEEKNQPYKESKSTFRPTYLTDEELYGNLFVFNLAGFETTAGTITFTLAFLAAHPQYQAWVREEIDQYFNIEQTSYEDTFPKMTRCLALMHEVLRLACPVPQLIRYAKEPQLLAVGLDQTFEVPPETYVSGHFFHVHLNHKAWGPDASSFNPKRFISSDFTTGEEILAGPPKDAGYLPWLTGPRRCPGKKFSQVEFVAVIGSLLSRYEIEPLARAGQSPALAREKLVDVTNEFYFNISAHLRRPREARVRFVQRERMAGRSK